MISGKLHAIAVMKYKQVVLFHLISFIGKDLTQNCPCNEKLIQFVDQIHFRAFPMSNKPN